MPHYNLAFLGFGNVGRALAELLLRKREDIASETGITFRVTGIATGSHGIAVNPAGIDLPKALDLAASGGSLSALSAVSPPPATPEDFIDQCGADALFESIPVNYESGQPAVALIRRALERGMHVATANKGPVVHAYRELTQLAEKNGVRFYFESAVMDGAPVFALFRETLPAARIRAVRGVLNSTTNLILTRMENGDTFEGAVAYAQSIGIAETDPSGDLDGWDAAVKISALATVLMDTPIKPQEVDRTGIRGITPERVRQAREQGQRWRLVCEAHRAGVQLKATVAPQIVGVDSPFYGVEGTTSIVQIESDVLGTLSLIEENPGPHTTAYGLLADFLNAVRR